MDQQKKLETLSLHHNLQLTRNDRLFFTKYKFRLTIEMFAYKYPDLMYVRTIDTNAWKVDSDKKVNFLNAISNFAYKHEDRTRRENKTLQYYTSDLQRLEQIIEYVQKLRRGEPIVQEHQLLELHEIKYFPGSVTERNVRYRKKRLPYNKFKFQLLGERMEQSEYDEWEKWANQYPNDIKLPNSKYNRQWGIWAGEPIGYVSTEKVLQLIHFKLGSKINKIIEYQVKDDTINEN